MKRIATLLLAALFLNASPVWAELIDESADFSTSTLRSGLDNPWGISVRPARSAVGQFEVFVAESGAGRILRFLSGDSSTSEPVIEGFETAVADDTHSLQLGPVALAFITRNKLAVTLAHRQEARVYVIPNEAKPMSFEDYDHLAVSLATSSEPTGSGIHAIAATDTVAYLATDADSPKTRLLQAEIGANRLKRLVPLVKSNESQPRPFSALEVTPSDRPSFVVVAQSNLDTEPSTSELVFISPDRGKEVLCLETELSDVSALAYSPSGNLYAVNCNWEGPGQGGIYRLDDARSEGRQYCRAVRIASADRPVALAFASNTELFVTCLGPNDQESSGSVLRINGSF